MSARPPSLPDPDAMMQITARLDAARAATPCLAALQPDRLIRHVPGKRALLEGTADGRDVVIRMEMRPEDGATAREWAEMQRLWPHMSAGDLRTPEPICTSIGYGIIVQERVIGTPLLELFQSLEPPARAAWLSPAVEWLRKSTSMTESRHAARPDRWIARAAQASARQPFSELRVLELDILEQMRRLQPIVADAPWRSAICHGDFHPNNLIAHGARLTGIDLGGSQRMPLLKDMARFAMHMGRRRVRLSGQELFGVDAGCLAAFAQVFGLDPRERGATLPFFLGFEALIRVEHTALPPARIRRAGRAYRALLQDMARTSPDAPLF